MSSPEETMRSAEYSAEASAEPSAEASAELSATAEHAAAGFEAGNAALALFHAHSAETESAEHETDEWYELHLENGRHLVVGGGFHPHKVSFLLHTLYHAGPEPGADAFCGPEHGAEPGADAFCGAEHGAEPGADAIGGAEHGAEPGAEG